MNATVIIKHDITVILMIEAGHCEGGIRDFDLRIESTAESKSERANGSQWE